MAHEQLFDVGPVTEPAKAPRVGTARIETADRSQVEWRAVAVDGLLPEDHVARDVWAFVERLDLSALYGRVQAMEGQPGRPAIDPKILMAIWILGTVDGIGSARELERFCREHAAYRWICGGVSVNYHTISDFRKDNVETFRGVLIGSVAVLLNQGLVDLQRVAQDGMRVRASAGAASFRRRKTLEECLKEAEARVSALQSQADEDDVTATRRQKAARERAAADRRARIEEALRQLPEIEAKKEKNRRKGEEISKKNEARASTTDPDARVMKMPDGGFRPAHNVQFASDTKSQVIVGVAVSNSGTDHGQMPPMIEQVEADFGRKPAEVLVDGGFADLDDIDAVSTSGSTVYAPVQKPKDPARDPHAPRKGDSEAIAEWRARMGTGAAKEIYKERASTAECVNAKARGHGLVQVLVRGTEQVLGVAFLAAIAHNLLRTLALSG